MKCDLILVGDHPTTHGWKVYRCARTVCRREIASPHPMSSIMSPCRAAPAQEVVAEIVTPEDATQLFPGHDPTLIGNQIAALIEAIGIPPCGGCSKRKAWLNKAHEWLRAQLSDS